MAEVIGVVASGVGIASLVAQIGNSITKLKSYWDELKEAPEDVRLLVEEIEVLYLSLGDVEDNQRRNPMSSKLLDNSSTSRSLELCKRGADSLKELADDLATEINAPGKSRRKWASAKVVFKKDKIDKYQSRLERAIRLLSLSYQSYTRALVQLQPDIIISRISNTMDTVQRNKSATLSTFITAPNSLSITASKNGSIPACQSQTEVFGSQEVQVLPLGSQYTQQVSKRRLKKREELVARYRVPLWAMKRAWDVEFSRSRSGWTVRLNCMNNIPRDSPVCATIRSGDLRGVQELFEAGQASVLDWCDDATLLQLAVKSGSFPICRFLLEHGADPNEAGRGMYAPITDILVNKLDQRSDARAAMDIFSLMTNVYDAEFDIWWLGWFEGPKEVFSLLQQHMEVPYYETALETLAETAMELARGAPWNSPELFRIAFAMPPGPIPLAAIHHKDYQGDTLLNAVAYAIGATLTPQQSWPESTANLPGWRALLRELVNNGADLHAVSELELLGVSPAERPPTTPFLDLLYGLVWHCLDIWTFHKNLDQLLKVWLEDLESCGVDLLEYGRKEKALYNEVVMQQDFRYRYDWVNKRWLYWHLIGFSFGASPSDWHIWGSEPTDGFAADFWSIIEPPEISLPGSWID